MLEMHLPYILLGIQFLKVLVNTHICWDSTVTSFLTHVFLIFWPYLHEHSKYLRDLEIICVYIGIFFWENPEYLGNSLALVYFCYRIQQGLL